MVALNSSLTLTPPSATVRGEASPGNTPLWRLQGFSHYPTYDDNLCSKLFCPRSRNSFRSCRT